MKEFPLKSLNDRLTGNFWFYLVISETETLPSFPFIVVKEVKIGFESSVIGNFGSIFEAIRITYPENKKIMELFESQLVFNFIKDVSEIFLHHPNIDFDKLKAIREFIEK